MQAVIGLGNPGNEYQGTRHNVGWLVLEELKQQVASSTVWSTFQHQAEVLKVSAAPDFSAENLPLWLIKPQLFMNRSGEVVRSLAQFYHWPLEQSSEWLWVIHDDLDLEVGQYKIQLGKGPKIHNGLESLYTQLGTKDFWHVRVGVDGRAGVRVGSGAEYVLGQFRPEEREVVEKVSAQIVSELLLKLSH
jgi:PTH1 family peptidyl-tRNA hydrolase